MPVEGQIEENFEKFHYFYSPYDCDRKCEREREKGDKLEIFFVTIYIFIVTCGVYSLSAFAKIQSWILTTLRDDCNE